MRVAVVLVLSALGASAAPQVDYSVVEQVQVSLFENFKSQYGRSYDDAREHEYRFQVFRRNLESIADHNRLKADRLGWTQAVNQFADLTPREFREKMLQRPGSLRRSANPVNVAEPLPKLGNSSFVDWVEQGVVLPVRNQEQCGSCWAFSATGSAASAYAQKVNQKPVNPSVQQLVSCAQSTGNNGCNGGSMDAAFQYIMNTGGLETWQAYPYTSGDGDTGTCKAKGPYDALKLTGFKDVPSGSVSGVFSSLEYGPVSIAVDASQWQFYSGGVFNACHDTRQDQLDHGVLAVGFDLKSHTLRVQNSWATSWGESGYIRLDLGRGNDQNMCGFALMASRPIA